MKRISILFLAVLLLLSCSAVATAADMGSYGENIALTVNYSHAGKAVAGAPVKLYRIASLDKNFHITVDSTFAEFKKDVESQNTQWDILANGLREHILENEIPCDDETRINTAGKAMFPTTGKTMQPGIYLLSCGNYRYDGNIYYSAPVIVSLPNFGPDGQLTNALAVNIKFTVIEDKPIDITVTKKWADKGYENKRPTTITVQLLKDGKPVTGEKKEIKEKTNKKWTYTWQNLDPIYDWSVEETRVTGYNAPEYSWILDGQDWECTITNTYPKGSSGGGKTPAQKLPQTGQLTWPIPWMAVSGMALFAAGWWLCFGSRKDPE